MSNVLLGWPNRIDAATLSGGSWSTTLPLANLQTSNYAQVARSVDCSNASTQFAADLGAARAVRMLALSNHNLSQAAQIRVSLGTTAGGTDVYAGGWVDAWEITFGTGFDEWPSDGWWDGMTGDDYVGSPYLALIDLQSAYTARYVTVEIDDTTNAAGFVQIGRAWIGTGLMPHFGVVHGMADEWVDRSGVTQMESGRVVAQVRRRARRVTFTLPALAQSTEFAPMHELLRRAGTTSEVLYVPLLSTPEQRQRTAMIGRLEELNSIAYPNRGYRSVAFKMIEWL